MPPNKHEKKEKKRSVKPKEAPSRSAERPVLLSICSTLSLDGSRALLIQAGMKKDMINYKLSQLIPALTRKIPRDTWTTWSWRGGVGAGKLLIYWRMFYGYATKGTKIVILKSHFFKLKAMRRVRLVSCGTTAEKYLPLPYRCCFFFVFVFFCSMNNLRLITITNDRKSRRCRKSLHTNNQFPHRFYLYAFEGAQGILESW